MRRVLSEVSITDMLLANTMIPKSKSMMSLPEALANTIESLNCSESKLLNKTLPCKQTNQLQSVPLGNAGRNKPRRSRFIKRNTLSLKSVTIDTPSEKSGSLHHHERRRNSIDSTANTDESRYSSRGNHSNDALSPNASERRFRKSRFIKKIDTNTILARVEQIPKWITITEMDIHAPIPGRPNSSRPSKATTECIQQLPPKVEPSQFAIEHNLLPLSELAQVMCIESSEAFAYVFSQPANKAEETETFRLGFNCESS